MMRIMDDDELFCSVTYITCPADPKKNLAIKLPFLILVIKNVKKYFTFEVQVDISTRLLDIHVDAKSCVECRLK